MDDFDTYDSEMQTVRCMAELMSMVDPRANLDQEHIAMTGWRMVSALRRAEAAYDRICQEHRETEQELRDLKNPPKTAEEQDRDIAANFRRIAESIDAKYA